MSIEGERVAGLRVAKLRGLVVGRWGDAERRPASFGPGAALLGGADGAPEAWVYLAEDRGLGSVLVWADRHRVGQLHVLADGSPGLLARHAGYFTAPEVDVWGIDTPATSATAEVDGRDLTAAAPSPLPDRPREAPASPELVDVLINAGLEIVVEGGAVRGEINGLEVARIVSGTTTAGVPIDQPQLEVGVGAPDREMTAMLHGDLSPAEQLERAAEVVWRHRRADARQHPLGQLAPERWLRAVLCRSPELVGVRRLRPAEPARPRANLRERNVAVAVGETPDDDPVVAVCSVGVDVDLVPAAADAHAFLDPSAALWLVVPERDDHPTTRRLVTQLRTPARVVTVPDTWRSAS